MRRGKCGFNCENCPYFGKPCIGCVIETCLVDKCIRGTSYTGITHPRSFCRLRQYCPIGGKDRPLPMPVPPLGRKQIARVKFSKFIPEIDVTDQRSWIWRDGFQVSEVFVPLWQLLTNGNILIQASSKGLHDYLDFDGRILLSTVMPDKLIDRLETRDYLKLINDLKPDATMVPDNYTYTDVPLYQSWSQTIARALGKDVESDTITYRFTIPSREHERFIDEIGSFKPEHIRVFEEYRRLKGEKG